MNNHIYIFKIDTTCKQCGYRNKGSYKLDEPMDVVCCGNCGQIITSPKGTTKKEKQTIKECIQKTIKKEEE